MAGSDQLVKKIVASSVKKVVKKATIKPIKSSADKVLKGTLYKNKTIKSITKGKGLHRYITTTDGEVALVDTKMINSLSRQAGTAKQMLKFAGEQKEGNLVQAYKALALRKAKAPASKKAVMDYHLKHRKQLKLSGVKPTATSLVSCEGKVLTLPKPYADVLQKEGVVKVLKHYDTK